MYEHQKISSMSAGDEIRSVYLINQASLQQSRNGPYWRLEFRDASGTLEAKIWSPLSLTFPALACNSQSWLVDASQGVLRVFRNKKVITIIPKSRLAFYNTIDLGIFLCFLEVALLHNEYSFNRELFLKDEDSKKLLVAEYKIKK